MLAEKYAQLCLTWVSIMVNCPEYFFLKRGKVKNTPFNLGVSTARKAFFLTNKEEAEKTEEEN